MPQSTQVLTYAPDCWVYVATDSGMLDISADITSGTISRVENAVSTASFVVNNKGARYSNVIKPMDRIIVFLQRITKLQVFSGYVDDAPFYDLYPTTTTIAASCTLKRLMYTYWNPNSEASSSLLDQKQYQNGQTDGGLGLMLVEVLANVAGWDKNQIQVQNIPASFLNYAQSVVDLDAYATGLAELNTILGIPTSSSSPTSTASTPLSGNGNQQQAYNYFVGKGLTPVQSAAIVGNLMQESGVNPSSVEGGGLPGRGIAQWSVNGRWKGVLALAQLQGLPPTTLSVQLDFMWQELNSSYSGALASLKTQTDIAGATTAFEQQYEAAGLPDMSTRISDAQKILAQYGSPYSLAGPTGVTSTSPTTTTSTIPTYGPNASTQTLMSIYGSSAAAVEANLVTINFQGFNVPVHKLVAGVFQTVDQQITAANTGYRFLSVSTFAWRNMRGVGAPAGVLSWHSFGIAMDINPATNPYTTAQTHDIPQSIVDIFTSNGFGWGGDWTPAHDWMHFQYQGGGSTPATTTTATDTTADPVANGLFGYVFQQAQYLQATAAIFTGNAALIDEQPLLSTIQGIATAGLRNFMSAPDGQFLAYYPDYFGIAGTTAKMVIEEIEMLNVSITKSDDNMTTHVFVADDQTGQGVIANNVLPWLQAAAEGSVSVNDPSVMKLMLGIDPATNPDYVGSTILQRYGERPYIAQFPSVSSPLLGYVQSLMIFMQKWGMQYTTTIQTTFMPELFPGMRIQLADYNLIVYVTAVTHTIDRQAGFATTIQISSPSTTATNPIAGLPVQGGGGN
jgi:Phage tail lysozyme/D-alanyl-D-alanine carboxypeptidase